MPIARWFASARSARLAAGGLIALSFVLDGNDWSSRLDLELEFLSRASMLAVAAFALRATRGDACARLLVWGLIGVSFDLFWQTNFDPGWSQWSAMTIKYVAVSAGLATLLRLTAVYGDGTSRFRTVIAAAAPWFGLVLAITGLLHGSLWITQCRADCDPAEHPIDALAITSYNGYLLLGAVLRAAMIAAAVAGIATASPRERQRLILVTVACVLFATGTLVNFSARLVPFEGMPSRETRDVLDAALTLAFPLVLWIAILRRRLFDVEYVVRRALVYGFVILAIGLSITVAEQILHYEIGKWGDDTLIAEHVGPEAKDRFEMLVEIGVGLALALLFKPLEEAATRRVEHAMAPEREKRLDVLREIAERIPLIASAPDLERRLLRSLERGTDARFVEAYVRDPDGGYAAALAAPGTALHLPGDAAATLARGKPLKGAAAQGLVPGAELALPMVIAGKLFGILVCGSKRSEVSYAPDELRELTAIAREAGSSLFAFRAAA